MMIIKLCNNFGSKFAGWVDYVSMIMISIKEGISNINNISLYIPPFPQYTHPGKVQDVKKLTENMYKQRNLLSIELI